MTSATTHSYGDGGASGGFSFDPTSSAMIIMESPRQRAAAIDGQEDRASSIVMLREDTDTHGEGQHHQQRNEENSSEESDDDRPSWWVPATIDMHARTCWGLVIVIFDSLILIAIPAAILVASSITNYRALEYVYCVAIALASYEFVWLAYRVRLRVFLPLKLHQKQTSRELYQQIISYSADLTSCAVTRLADRFVRGYTMLVGFTIALLAMAVVAGVLVATGESVKLPMTFLLLCSFLGVLSGCFAPTITDGVVVFIRYAYYTLATLNVVLDDTNKTTGTSEDYPIALEPFWLLLFASCLTLIARVFTSKDPMESVVMVFLDISGLLYLYCAGVVLAYFSQSAMEHTGNALLGFFVIVWSSEIGSFVMERLLKGIQFPWNHPVAPRVSSRQNLETLLGALAFGVGATYAAASFVDFEMETYWVAGISALAILFSHICKLFLLSLKKVAKIPVTANYLQIGGGLIDRMDTLLFMAVVFCAFFERQVFQ